MCKLLKSVIAPIMSLCILITGNALFLTFTSIRLKLDGHSIEIVGYASSCYFAGLLVGSLKCNHFIERVGHIRAYATFAALFVFFSMIQSMFNFIPVWLTVRFFIGFFMAGLFVVIESWLLAKTSPQQKGKIFSMYMITYFASQGIGQLLLTVANPMTILPFSIIILLASISIVPVCVTKISAPIIQGTSCLNVFKLIKTSPLGVVGCFFAGLVLGPAYGLIPIYIKMHGFSVDEISYAMGITILGGLFLQWPIGQLSDIIDRRKVIFLSAILTAVAAFIIGLNSIYSFLHVFILLGIFGSFCFTIYPLSISHGSDMVKEKDLIAATAAFALTYSIGASVGPVLASYSMNFWGAKGLFFYIAIISVFLAITSIYFIIRKEPTPKEEKVTYSKTERATTLASEIEKKVTNNKND